MKYEPIIEKNVLFKPSRIRSLYSNFNCMIDDNPEGYEANIEAWVNLIESIMVHDNTCILDTTNLVEDLSFRSDGLIYKPLSLDCVLSEMINSGKLTDSESILVDQPPGLLQKGFNWIFGNSKVSAENLIVNSQKSGNYLRKNIYICNARFSRYEEIIIRKMRACYNEILKIGDKYDPITMKHEDATSIINTEDMFNNILKETGVEYKYFDVVKKLLVKENSALKVETYNGQKLYVRFNENADEKDREKAKIVFEMNLQIKKISSKVDACNRKMLEYDIRLRTLITDKANKEILKIILRLKKHMESSALKLMNNLSNLEILLGEINMSNDNLKYLKVVNSSNILLKRLNSEAVADINIDGLMNDIHDNIDQVEEINEKLKIDINDSAKEDKMEEEIDEELCKLEKEVKECKNKKSTQTESVSKDNRDLIERFERLKLSPEKPAVENEQSGDKPQEKTEKSIEKQAVRAT